MQELSVPPVAEIGEAATLTDPVWHNAEVAPAVVQFVRDGGEVTCAQFRDEVVALARGLIAAGIEPGSRVGLMSRTRYEWTLIDYALWACGAVTVPLYETSSTEQVAWILADSGAVACFVETEEHRQLVADLRDQLPALEQLWRIDSGEEPGHTSGDSRSTGTGRPGPLDSAPGAVDELVGEGAAIGAGEVEQRRRAINAASVATIIYTSGTTGRPKGCVLSHRNMYTDVANAIPGLTSLFAEGGRTLLFLPLAHSFARLIQLGAVAARVTMGHTADIRSLAAELQAFRPTFVLSVPRVFEKLHNAAQQRAYADGKGAAFRRAEQVAISYSAALDSGGPGLLLRLEHALFDRLVYGRLRAALGGQCRAAISGGAPLGERLAHFFRGVGITIYEGYGLTETSPACAVNLEHALKIGTVGRPLPGVTIRIAEDGEILVKGDHVFTGYWNNETATAEVLDGAGWFHSGDIGELDDGGFLRITGRKKELIVTAGGKNVAPAVLEDRLRGHPLVSQCVVVGDRMPFIAALITIDEESLPAWKHEHAKPAQASVADLADDADLRAAVQAGVDEANRAVSHAEAIKSFRILPRDFTEAGGELTPSLKVRRTVVLKEYSDEIAAIYAR